MKTIGVLWDDEVNGNEFTEEDIEETYREFSKLASKHDAEVVHANYKDIEGKTIKNGFRVTESGTEEVVKVTVDAVLNKFNFNEKTEGLTRSIEDDVRIINRYDLEKICSDKFRTAQELEDLSPKTLRASKENVKKILETHGKAVVKPRNDHGGNDVSIIDNIADYHHIEEGIVQGFIDSSGGIPGTEISGVHDLRVLVVSGEPVKAYAREPGEGLVANVAMGGSMTFLELKQLPDEAEDLYERVIERFEEYSPSFYSIDMVFDKDENAWLLECNTKPGLTVYGDPEIKKNKLPIMEKVIETLLDD